MVVVVDEFGQDPTRVGLAQGNQMVEAIGGQKFDQALQIDFGPLRVGLAMRQSDDGYGGRVVQAAPPCPVFS